MILNQLKFGILYSIALGKRTAATRKGPPNERVRALTREGLKRRGTIRMKKDAS